MKKLVVAIALLVGSVTFAQDRVITFSELPKAGQQFITKYFGAKQVSLVTLDDDYLSKNYELVLTNGTKIEFAGNGEWKEVDGKRNAIPTGFIPKNILSYVKKSFPNTEIVKIERERLGYSVELTNGLDLDFNSKGDFLRVDD